MATGKPAKADSEPASSGTKAGVPPASTRPEEVAETPGEVVAARTTDTDDTETDTFTKVFVVLKPWPALKMQDDANKAAVIHEMCTRGLRPADNTQPKLASREDHPDGYSENLTYTCPAVPSGDDVVTDVIQVDEAGKVSRPIEKDAKRDEK